MNLRLRIQFVRPHDSTVTQDLPALEKRRILRWPSACLVALLAAWGLMAVLPPAPVPYPWPTWTGPVMPVPQLPQPWEHTPELAAKRQVDGRFAAGGTFAGELARHGVGGSETHAIAVAARDAVDLRRIRPGQSYRLYFADDDSLVAIRYQIDRQSAWFFTREGDTWATSKVVIPVRTQPLFISATIAGSLESALLAQVPQRAAVYELVAKVADLYGWDVDFNFDLQLGDRLDLVVDQRFVEDEFIGFGDVLAAEFHVGGRVLPVVRFVGAGDEGVRFYAPDGTSLRRAFLRSPVKYQRISSRFSGRRVHPVTGVARAHRGIDYVADPGTPVQATADGTVVEAGYSAEPGRYVRLRHHGSYSSVYMHLSRIADGIRNGATVRQGQVIGYVGKTGNATGYHLHYGLILGNGYVDPMQLQMPAADPVSRSEWPQFLAQRDSAMRLLREGQARIDVQVAGAAGGM